MTLSIQHDKILKWNQHWKSFTSNRQSNQLAVRMFAYVLILIYLSLRLTSANHTFTVLTTKGEVSGKTAVSRNGVPYFAYLGIPYAEPPIGELRFQVRRIWILNLFFDEVHCNSVIHEQDPREAKSWLGVKKVDEYPPACPQSGWYMDTFMGDEDCLYVNVFTPSKVRLAISKFTTDFYFYIVTSQKKT